MKKILLTLIGVLLLAATASAAFVDFRQPAFAPALNQPDFDFTTADGLELTFTALPAGPNTKLWWDSVDGLGIQSDVGYEPDEIEGAERLRLDFSETVYLNRIFITDLFSEWGYLEIGRIQIDDNTPVVVQGVELIGATNGELNVDFGPNQLADFILFSAPGLGFGSAENHEFSVGGVDVAAVPVPPAVLLLGSGVLGLVVIRRRKKV